MSSANACKIIKSPKLYFQFHLLSPLPPRELDIAVICCFYYSTHCLFYVVPKPSAYHNALAFRNQTHPLSSSFPSFPSFYYYLYLHSISVHHQTMRKANLWLLHWLSQQSPPCPWDLVCSVLSEAGMALQSHCQWHCLSSTLLDLSLPFDLVHYFFFPNGISPSFVFKLLVLSSFSTCFCLFLTIHSSPSGFMLNAYVF